MHCDRQCRKKGVEFSIYAFRNVDTPYILYTMTFLNKLVPRTLWISYYFFLFTKASCNIIFWKTSENILLMSHKKGKSMVMSTKEKVRKKKEKKKEKTY